MTTRVFTLVRTLGAHVIGAYSFCDLCTLCGQRFYFVLFVYYA